MRPREPRIPPLTASEWGPDVMKALSTFVGGAPPAGNSGGERRVVNALSTLMHHPALAESFLGFNGHLLWRTSLSDRVRELLILRTGWLCRSDYEWAQHVLLARDAGLSDAEIERVRDGASAEWSENDAALLMAVDELHEDRFIGDATRERLGRFLERRQIMDLVFTVGAYMVLAMAFNSFGVQLDPGLEVER